MCFSVVAFYIWNQNFIQYAWLVPFLLGIWLNILTVSLIPFYMLKVFDVRPLLSQKWSVDKIHEAWRLWFIHLKEEIDFPFSSESVTKKLFSVFWLLTLLPFMAFFLLIIHWVIMYSCKMQNQLTCNQVWTQEMLVLSISGLTVSYPSTHGTVVYSIFR